MLSSELAFAEFLARVDAPTVMRDLPSAADVAVERHVPSVAELGVIRYEQRSEQSRLRRDAVRPLLPRVVKRAPVISRARQLEIAVAVLVAAEARQGKGL